MNTKIIDWMKETRHLLPESLGDVLDVGSLNVNGSAREVYTFSRSYLGVDMREGKDVDIVMNAHSLVLRFGKDSFDIVVCMNILEHDDRFWITLEEVNSVLRKGGYLVFCVPTFSFPIHSYPEDYWRMSEQAVKEIVFMGFEVLDLKEIWTKEDNNQRGINPIVCAIGRKL